MDRRLDLRNLHSIGRQLLERRVAEAKVYDLFSGLETIQEADTHADSAAEADSRLLSFANDSLRDPVSDPFARMNRLLDPGNQLDALIHGRVDPLADQLRSLRNTLSTAELGELAKRGGPLAFLQETTHKSLEMSLAGDEGRLDHDQWRFNQITSSLVLSLEAIIASYGRRTRGMGVELPEARGGLSLDGGNAYLSVLRKARTSVSVAMFQFEHSVVLAETVQAMQRVSAHGGFSSVTLNAPTSIAVKNALSMAVLRRAAMQSDRFGRMGAAGFEAGHLVDPKIMGQVASNAVMGNVMLQFDPRSQTREENRHILGGGENQFAPLAHQKFIAANLDQSIYMRLGGRLVANVSALEHMAFAIGSANVTTGALGALARDGVFTPQSRNIELTYLASWESLKVSTDKGMDVGDFARLMESAKEAEAFAQGRVGRISDANPYFVDGGQSYKRIYNILDRTSSQLAAGSLKDARVTLFIDAFASGATWDGLQSRLKGLASTMAKSGGRIEILMEGLSADNWQDTLVRAGAVNERGKARTLKATGGDLGLIRQIMGFAGYDNVHFIDNLGRRQHGKGLFVTGSKQVDTDHLGRPIYDNAYGEGVFTSANVTDRGSGFGDAYGRGANVEMGIHVTSDTDPLLLGAMTHIRRRHGTGLEYAPATVGPAQAGTIYTTPFTAVGGLQDGLMNQLKAYGDQMRAKGLLVDVEQAYGDKAAVMKTGLNYRDQRLTDVLSLEMHQVDSGSLYLPQFHKTIKGGVGFVEKDGYYTETRFIDADQIVADAMTKAMQFVKDRVIKGELRAMAIQELRQAKPGQAITETMVSERVDSLMRHVYTQQMLKQRARAFLRDKLGSFDAQPMGRRAYRAKDVQLLAFEAGEGGLNPADLSFRRNKVRLADRSLFFQKASDSYMQRTHILNPVTGEPVTQMAKIYGREAFNTLTMASVTRQQDRQGTADYLSLMLPFSKLMQIPQRLGNIFSAEVYRQFKRNQVTGELDEMPLYTLPMQAADAFDRAGNPIDAHQVKFYRNIALMEIGPNVSSDIAYANAGFYENMLLGVERPLLQNFDRNTTEEGFILERLADLQTKKAELTERNIALGEVRVATSFGEQRAQLTMRNPAYAVLDSDGFSRVEGVGYYGSATDRTKQRLDLHTMSYRAPTGGDRITVGGKAVVAMAQEQAFHDIYHQHLGSDLLSHDFLRLNRGEAGRNISMILNPSQIKHGDLMLQTGAALLAEKGGAQFMEAMLGALDTRQGRGAFQTRLAKRYGALNENFYARLSNQQKQNLPNFRIREMSLKPSDAFFGEMRKVLVGIQAGAVLNTGNTDHQVAAMLAWSMWEEYHLQRLDEGQPRRGDLGDLATDLTTGTDRKLTRRSLFGLSGITVQEKLAGFFRGQKLSREERQMATAQINRQAYVPVILGTSFVTNTTALSSRPEVGLLTYLNFAENTRMFQALFPEMSVEQKAVLQMASLYESGRAGIGIGGGKQTTVMFGALSAPILAAMTPAGAIDDITVNEMVGGQAIERTYRGSASLAGGLQQLQHLDLTGPAAPEEARTLVEMLSADGNEARRQLTLKVGRQKNVEIEGTLKGQYLAFQPVFDVMKRAGVGATTIYLPKVEMRQTLFGNRVRVLGVQKVYMPEVAALESLINTQADSSKDAAGAFVKLLQILGKDHGLFRNLYELHEGGAKSESKWLAITSEESNQLERMGRYVVDVQNWYDEMLGSDLIKQVFGLNKGPGVTFTATMDHRLPLGFAAYGETAFRRKLKTHEKAFSEAFGGKEGMTKLYGYGDKLERLNVHIDKLQSANNDAKRQHIRSTIQDTATDLFNAVFDRYEKSIASVSIDGKQHSVSMEPLIQFRRNLYRGKIDQLLLEGGLHGDKLKKHVTDLLLEAAVSDPTRFVSVGGRAGAPLTSEMDLFHVVRLEEFNALLDSDGYGGFRYDSKLNKRLVMMSVSAQGLTLGDFDGDADSLQDATRFMLLKNKQKMGLGLSGQEKRDLIDLETYLGRATSGETLVQSAARYSVMGDRLLRQFHDPNQRSKAIYEAGQTIQQVRDLYGNYDRFLGSYREGLADAHKAGLTGEELFKRAGMNAMEKTLSKLDDSLVNMIHINDRQLQFLQEYVGFAGTEVIGKAFNASYQLLLGTGALSGKGQFTGQAVGAAGEKRELRSLLDGEGRIQLDANGVAMSVGRREFAITIDGSTQVERIGGFVKQLSQMARDSLKPKSIKEDEVLSMMDRFQSGAHAAMENVTGARTTAYLMAITKGETVARNLFGQLLEDTFHERKLEQRRLTPANREEYVDQSRLMLRQFMDVASYDMARFQYTAAYDGKPDKQQLIEIVGSNLDTLTGILEKHTVGSDLAARLRSSSDLGAALTADGALHGDLLTALDTIKLQGGRLVSDHKAAKNQAETFTLGEHMLALQKRTELGLAFSSLDGEGGVVEYLQRREAGQAKGFEFNLSGLEDVMLLGREVSLYQEQARAAAGEPDLALTMGFDEFGNALSERSRLTALMGVLSRPHTQQATGEAMRMLDDLARFSFADNANADAVEERINQLDTFEGRFGSKLRQYMGLGNQQAKQQMVASLRGEGQTENLFMQFVEQHTPEEQEHYRKQLGDEAYEQWRREKLRAVKETFGMVDRPAEFISDNRFDLAFEKLSAKFGKHFDRGAQSGRANLELVSNTGGAVIGAAIGRALHGQGDVSSVPSEIMAGVLGSDPRGMAFLMAQADDRQKWLTSASLVSGLAGGALAEAAAARFMRNRNPVGAAVVGLGANVVGAALASAGATHAAEALLARPTEERAPEATGLAAGSPSTLALLLGQLAAGLVDDPTGLVEVFDQYGEPVVVEGNGDPTQAAWMDGEDGALTPREVRSGLEEAGLATQWST